MSSYERSAPELWAQYEAQRKALKSSCAACDDGERWEAARIATTIATFVRDGKRNTISLLTQLGVKDKLKYVDSSRGFAGFPPLPLCVMNIGSGSYAPSFVIGQALEHREVGFEEWWNGDVYDAYIDDKPGARLTRGGLILHMRDKDGGSHFDPKLTDPVYVQLSKKDATSFYAIRDGFQQRASWAAEATVRQIAWEFDQTLDAFEREAAMR